MNPIAPPSRYIPAREEWLKGWCGPVECHDSACRRWIPAVIGGFADDNIDRRFCLGIDVGLLFSASTGGMRLDPTRPEVRDMLARALGLPESHRVGEWAAGLCWWAGVTGRRVPAVVRIAPNLYIGGNRVDIVSGSLPIRIDPKRASVLAVDCALVTDAGLLLPPVTPGGVPILWSNE